MCLCRSACAWALPWVLGAVVVGWSVGVEAQNQDPFFLSNEAALTAGAVTAVSDDSGAPWYNPAGLVTIERSSININSSAFVLRFRKADNVLRLRLPDGGEDRATLRSLEVSSVPSSLVVSRRYGDDFSVALGVFVPQQDGIDVSADLNNASSFDGAQFDFGQRLTWTQEHTRYHVGPSAAWRLAPGLRVGGSFFAVYERIKLKEEFLSGSIAQDDRSFVFERFRSELTDLGTQLVLGVQWEMVPSLTLGVTLRSPVVVLSRTGEAESLVSDNRVAPMGPPALDLVFEQQNLDATGPMFSHPGRVHAGLSWDFGRGHVAIEGDVTGSVNSPELYAVNDTVFNVRMGANYYTSPHTELGFGLFTDYSGRPRPTTFREVRVDYYGATAGVAMSTARLLADPEPSDDLIFTTTIGLRYSLGLGEVAGLVFEPFDRLDDTETALVDVVFHEIGVHVGSAIYF